MNRKFKLGRLAAAAMLILGAGMLTLSSLAWEGTPMQNTALLLSLVFLILAVVVVFVCCRCPHCGHVIFKKLFAVKRCPNCGRQL